MSFSIQWLEKRGITAPQGFRAGAARAAIKTEGDDVALILAPENTSAAAVFTTNQVKAAPVLVSAAHLAGANPRAIVVNAGNANCCTGARGLENARRMAEIAAHKAGIAPAEVLVCSTGIIGYQLPMEKLETALQTLKLSGEPEALAPEVPLLEAGDEGALIENLGDPLDKQLEPLDKQLEPLDRQSDPLDKQSEPLDKQSEPLDSSERVPRSDEWVSLSAESVSGSDERVSGSDERVSGSDESVSLSAESASQSVGYVSESPEITTSDAEELADVDERVARAFMTTDTVPKFCAAQLEIGGKLVTVGGQAKGVGMIGPNMEPLTLHATMLAFLTTDAQIERPLLQKLLERAVSRSFNSVTVDGDSSTNDTAILLASGVSNCRITEGNSALFSTLLEAVCIELSKKIARDGEGATKLVEIQVKGARREADAKTIALSIANSPLVKTALFGKDPNWGRIAMAAGKAGVPFDAAKLSFSLGAIEMFRNGEPVDFDLKSAEAVLEAENVSISLDLGDGSAKWTAWTCDYSYDYIKINAEYHT